MEIGVAGYRGRGSGLQGYGALEWELQGCRERESEWEWQAIGHGNAGGRGIGDGNGIAWV